jgi:uncharacterized protein (DUF1800 family)
MFITPYTGTWSQEQRLHLLRRTLFGATKADIATFATSSMTDMVTTLLTIPTTAPPPPIIDYVPVDPTAVTNLTTDVVGSTWVNNRSESVNNGNRQNSLRGWWAGLMVQQERNIREKMTLFWHNHIPTDIPSVSEAIYCYRYNALLRQHCLGNFKTLIREMTTQPAMLVYLSGQSNTGTSPNENYGRELQELFCIGKDISPSYTEGDVQAAAQVLTGWQIDTAVPTTAPFVPTYNAKFTASRHKTGTKAFSSFYNNATVSSSDGVTELNALLNIIFAHPEVARFVVRKIYRFFVYYKIDATIEADVIVPLADLFRSGGYEIKPVMQALFTSQHFYDMATANSSMIKSPMDHNLSLARIFGLTLPTDTVNLYKGFRYIGDEGFKQGQRPGDPPNVAGWTAYYQTPNFHELWITAETLRRKKEYCDRLLTNNVNGMKIDVLAFTMTLSNPADPIALIDEVLSLLHTLPSDASLKTALKAILLSNQTSDYYWTTAWNNYVGAPTNTTFANTARTRLQTLYQAITNMAEFHLS